MAASHPSGGKGHPDMSFEEERSSEQGLTNLFHCCLVMFVKSPPRSNCSCGKSKHLQEGKTDHDH